MIRDWTERNFEFAGYVTGFDPRSLGDRDELRHDLGYGPDEKVCIVSVGGSGVGGHLLRRVIASFDDAKRQVPELRMIVVAGPRIDPESLPQPDGLEVVAYVHNLYRHLAACDLAVVQGGLTTAMELTASRRPFLYFPLRHHFEQNMHVAHRLDRYGAGRRMDFDTADPDVIAGGDRRGDRTPRRLPRGRDGRRAPRRGEAGRAAVAAPQVAPMVGHLFRVLPVARSHSRTRVRLLHRATSGRLRERRAHARSRRGAAKPRGSAVASHMRAREAKRRAGCSAMPPDASAR